jgi:hypothetical protein
LNFQWQDAVGLDFAFFQERCNPGGGCLCFTAAYLGNYGDGADLWSHFYAKSATIAAWQLLNSFGWLGKALKYKFTLAVVYGKLFTS